MKVPKSKKRRLRMREEFLKKDFCVKRAQKLISYNDWENVSVMQIAKEIYGHAYVYYYMKWLKKTPLTDRLIYEHVADGIDVEDKTDKFQLAWEWIWKHK